MGGRVARRILAEQPSLVDDAVRSTTVSVGVAAATETGDDRFGQLEGAAWAALCHARRQRRDFA